MTIGDGIKYAVDAGCTLFVLWFLFRICSG
jgi:hypothetical protein